MASYYTYILQSEKDSSYYIGYSGDPVRRLEKHNAAGKGYTASKQPWRLVYTEEFETKTEAIQRERFLKRQKNRGFYQRLIAENKQ